MYLHEITYFFSTGKTTPARQIFFGKANRCRNYCRIVIHFRADCTARIGSASSQGTERNITQNIWETCGNRGNL
jgi:hypothetical protein